LTFEFFILNYNYNYGAAFAGYPLQVLAAQAAPGFALLSGARVLRLKNDAGTKARHLNCIVL